MPEISLSTFSWRLVKRLFGRTVEWATSNAMATVVGAELIVCDVGVGRPTGALHLVSALTPERFAECLAAGRQSVASIEADLLIVGELGIGNTTAAAAVCTALYGGDASEWTGRGTGVDDDGYARKVAERYAPLCPFAKLLDELEGRANEVGYTF